MSLSMALVGAAGLIALGGLLIFVRRSTRRSRAIGIALTSIACGVAALLAWLAATTP